MSSVNDDVMSAGLSLLSDSWERYSLIGEDGRRGMSGQAKPKIQWFHILHSLCRGFDVNFNAPWKVTRDVPQRDFHDILCFVLDISSVSNIVVATC
jgi:hypothetical protein